MISIVGVDWLYVLLPAALAMLHGASPYTQPGFYNPPWALLPLIPFALLPQTLGQISLVVVSVLAFAFIAYRLGAKPVSMLLFITSYPVFSTLLAGNIDWMPLLALVLPAPIGLILAVVKPQIGLGIVLYWLVQSWRWGGIKEVARNFLPVSIMLGGSFLLYGPWFMQAVKIVDVDWNLSLFPYSIPLGLFLLALAFTKQDKAAASVSSPFFSPYFSKMALSTLLLPLFKYPLLFAGVWVLLWILFIIQRWP